MSLPPSKRYFANRIVKPMLSFARKLQVPEDEMSEIMLRMEILQKKPQQANVLNLNCDSDKEHEHRIHFREKNRTLKIKERICFSNTVEIDRLFSEYESFYAISSDHHTGRRGWDSPDEQLRDIVHYNPQNRHTFWHWHKENDFGSLKDFEIFAPKTEISLFEQFLSWLFKEINEDTQCS